MGVIKKICSLFAVMFIVSVITFTSCKVVGEVKEEVTYKGIDISEHQGIIDQSKLDVSTIVVRLGYSGYETGACRIDNCFIDNMEKLSDYEGEVALYWASHAITVEEIERENEFIIATLNKISNETVKKIDYLFIDREQSGTNQGRADNLSKNQFNEVLIAQVKGLQKMLPDMKIGVYTNTEYLVNMIDLQMLGDVPCWFAWYISETPTSFDDAINRVNKNSIQVGDYLRRNILMWQYSDEGNISGINEIVDLNLVSYKMLD